MIPLSAPNLNGRELEYIKKCIDTNWVSSSGTFVKSFEDAICNYVKSRYAVACINGTAGLHIALNIAGVGEEDEVIVPTLTFIAPVNAVRYLGAEPIFMDCDNYMNIDVVKLKEFCAKECRLTNAGLKNRSTGKIIKAVLPVHIFGNPFNMQEIMKISKRYHLKVVEDATESLGAYYTKGIHKGRFTGTIADLGVFSFNGNKIITTGGGGMIVTNNKSFANKARYLIEQAKDDPVRYIHNEVGYNFRLSNLQAALGLAQLKKLRRFISIKKRNYELYYKLLCSVKGVKLLGIPPGTAPNYWFYSLLIEKKDYGMGCDKLIDCLTRKKIQSRPIWYLNHLQRPYRINQAYRITNAQKFWKSVLNLPCSVGLGEDQIYYVASSIKSLANSN